MSTNESLKVTKLNPTTNSSIKSQNQTSAASAAANNNASTMDNASKSNHNSSTATGNNEKNNTSVASSKSQAKITSREIQQIPPFRGKSSKSTTSSSSNDKVTTVIATPGFGDNTPVKIQYCNQRVVGNGSFGVVYKADLCGTSIEHLEKQNQQNSGNSPSDTANNGSNAGVETGNVSSNSNTSDTQPQANSGSSDSSNKDKRYPVAIKKVLQDKRFKNRELAIMRNLKHINIVQLKFFFYCIGEKKDEVYLNLILEFVPETVYRVSRHYNKQKQMVPMIFVRLYMYQLLRALAHIHASSICHRDIKPQNLLVNPQTAVLKLCDFGSAKQLVPGEPNVSYICSRYYRAPELIFGATDYTCSIDVWSAGCVLAELMMGQPIFPGESGVDQLVEIIKLLGTPTKESIKEMNPNYTEFKFPTIKAHPWSKVFKKNTPASAIDMCSSLLEYSPKKRFTAWDALGHTFFDELRDPETRLPNKAPLPELFNFSDKELKYNPQKNSLLMPKSTVAEGPSASKNE